MNSRLSAKAIFLVVATWGGLSPAPCHAQEAQLPRKVVKSDREWSRILSPAAYMVTRQKATEAPFTGKNLHVKGRGIFVCVCCGAELFSTRTKFESGTGWPSFWQPLSPASVATQMDYSTAETRVEVECPVCNAHLGHVFNDGPPPTGLRYCINSVSLKFIPDSRSATASKSGSKTLSRKKKSASKSKSSGKSPSDTNDEPSEPETTSKNGKTPDTETDPKEPDQKPTQPEKGRT